MSKAQFVKQMFDDISSKYDLLNDILSLGMHRIWKKRFVQNVLKSTPKNILDCATGTGDLAFYAEKLGGQKILGIDFSEKMIDVAKARARLKHSATQFQTADLTKLPFPDKSYDAAMVSFGVRNLDDLEHGLRELSRVSKTLSILEFGQPLNKIYSKTYFLILRLYVPIFGLLTGRKDAYEYLIQSSEQFPSGPAFIEILKRNTDYKIFEYKSIFGGIAYAYQGSGEQS
ncbi:MAG: ubiquinone/menaquinone biosynthesis methyltransferase [Bdellovibrionales bacterium]|nr:ubiquinone/menaquinone biosynthesis methyltransferase [Oligoflexia bacterium]